MSQQGTSCPKPTPADLKQHAESATVALKALANPNRLMILCMLVEGEKSVGELNQGIELSQSALSQHLAKLRSDGMVETRRESQTIYYSMKAGVAREVIQLLYQYYCA